MSRSPADTTSRRGIALIAAAGAVLAAAPALGADIPVNYAEFGQQVNGYQEQFNGTSLPPGWTVTGSQVATVSGGYLHCVSAGTTVDPTKVLYQGAPYDGIQQNVLVMMRVNSSSSSDARMGATASNTSNGQGVNAMFRGTDANDVVSFLDDFIAHGPQNAFNWANGTWYWIRFLHSPNRPAATDPLFNGVNDCFAKVWPADGTSAEPANYMWAWASNDSRSGFAGIQTTIYSGSGNFDVGYFLLQANGLPTITAGPPAPLTPPDAPTNLTADYEPGVGVTLNWQDNSKDEVGFQVERSPAGYPFSLFATTAADATTHLDAVLYPNTTYKWRVRAFNVTGNSDYTNEVEITTDAAEAIPAPPEAPSPLNATQLFGANVLTWTDRSTDETRFDLVRSEGGEGFKSLSVLQADVTSFSDYSLHPGWPYTYRIRALSLQGPSPFTNNAAAAAPGTLELTIRPASLTDSPKFGKDKVSLTAAYVQNPVRPGTVVDPVRDGVELQVGSSNAPVIVSVAAGDKTWKVKKAKATWKSPKGVLPKVAVAVDTVKQVMTVSVSGFSFSSAPGLTSRTLFAVGLDGGIKVQPWTEKKPGVLYVK